MVFTINAVPDQAVTQPSFLFGCVDRLYEQAESTVKAKPGTANLYS